jgi:hypothetical protein
MMTGVNRRRPSWLCIDVRTVISSVEYMVTVEFKQAEAQAGVGRQTVELNEQWVYTPSAWTVKWDGFPGLSAG